MSCTSCANQMPLKVNRSSAGGSKIISRSATPLRSTKRPNIKLKLANDLDKYRA